MSVWSAARTLGSESGWSLSNLEMQKTLYVAQMLHLGRTGRPLFDNRIEAWDYGPVVPDLYHEAKRFGRQPVADIFDAPHFEALSCEAMSIRDALIMTRHMSAGQLVAYTHRPGGAWEMHYKPHDRSSEIPMSAILRDWAESARPSDEAVEWAEVMAAQIEGAPSRYLDAANERAFRARVLGERLQ